MLGIDTSEMTSDEKARYNALRASKGGFAVADDSQCPVAPQDEFDVIEDEDADEDDLRWIRSLNRVPGKGYVIEFEGQADYRIGTVRTGLLARELRTLELCETVEIHS